AGEAAPMARAGRVWQAGVWLVTNCSSRSMVAWMRLGSIWLIRSRRAGSKFPVFVAEPTLAEAALAGATTETTGAATAVTAEAEGNARRLGPFEPHTGLFSMPRIKNGSPHPSHPSPPSPPPPNPPPPPPPGHSP